MDVKKPKQRTRKPKLKKDSEVVDSTIETPSPIQPSIMEINSIEPINVTDKSSSESSTITTTTTTIEHKKIEDIILEYDYPFTPTSSPVVSESDTESDENRKDENIIENNLKDEHSKSDQIYCNDGICIIKDNNSSSQSSQSKDNNSYNKLNNNKLNQDNRYNRYNQINSTQITYDTLLNNMGVKNIDNKLVMNISTQKPSNLQTQTLTNSQLRYHKLKKYIYEQQRLIYLQQLRKQKMVLSSYIDNVALEFNGNSNNDKLFKIIKK